MCLLDDNYSLKKQGSLASLGLREKTPLKPIATEKIPTYSTEIVESKIMR